jgi:hypothetical protein
MEISFNLGNLLMKSSCSLALIYEIANDELGSENAKKTVSGVLLTVIDELERANAPVNEYNLEKSLDLIANRFATAAGRLAS